MKAIIETRNEEAKKRRLVLAIMLMLVVLRVNAQVIPLDSVLAVIERQNPMLKEYDSKAKALDAYAAGAKNWMAPMVGFGPYWYPYPGETIMGEHQKGMLMASLEQDIPNPAKLTAQRNYANSKLGVEQQAKRVATNTLRSEAKMYYYKWLVSEKKLRVLNQNQRAVDLMLKLARIRYPYNQGSLSDVYKVEARLHEIQNMQLMINSDIEQSKYALKSLMNVGDDDSVMIDTATVVRFDPNQITYDTLALSTVRPDVKYIDESIKVMRLNQQIQRVQAKPDFRIRFEHMYPRGEGMPKQFSAMAMVSIPIAPWSSKMYKAEIKGMHYDIEGMKKSREALLIEARGMLAGMSHQLKSMQQQLINYETKIIPALRRSYESLMIAYEENREQLPMVLDGYEAMSMAQLDHLEKLESYYTMIVTYEKEVDR